MDRNVNYLVVGLFVISGLGAGAVFLFWLTTTTGTKPTAHYTVYFEDPIDGLATGGAVRYRGVQVGKVKDIRLDPERPRLIRVDVEIDAMTPVSAATTARLKPLGITGLSFIEISTGQTDERPPDQPPGEPLPVIYASGSQLERIINDLPEVTAQTIELIARTKRLLSEQNIERVGTTLNNLKHLSTDLNGLLTEKNATLAKTSLENLRALSFDLNGLLSEANVAELSNAFRSLSASSQNLDQLLDSLQRSATSLERSAAAVERVLTSNEAAIDRFVDKGLNEFTSLVRDGRDMIEAMRRLADKLGENPSQLIYPPNYRGIEIRK